MEDTSVNTKSEQCASCVVGMSIYRLIMVHCPLYFTLTSDDVNCPVWYEMSLTLFCWTPDISKFLEVSVLETILLWLSL